MITDEQIEKILYKHASRQGEFNLEVIRIIAERLAHLTILDEIYSLGNSAFISEDIADINSAYKRHLKDQEKLIEDNFWWIAIVIYGEAMSFYTTPVALNENKPLYKTVTTLIENAKSDLLKLIKNPVFVLRDLKSPTVSKAYNLEQTYRTILNEAFNYRNVSDELRNIALKRTETQLFESGIRYTINNSSDNAQDTTNANNAIRFNVLENVKNLIDKMQEVMGEQFGADAVELSAHVYPAPDHAPAQGHQFSVSEVNNIQSGKDFEDLNGSKFAGFERNIGAWNCRHYFMKIKKGAKPTYTQEQLDKILEDNEKGYTAPNGKHYTLYECTQVQRRYEREIRKAKEKYLYGKYLNDRQMMSVSRNRVGALTTQYKQFSRACDIPAKLERIKVKYYN